MLSRPSAPFLCQNSKQYLVLAFFAGVLLTLLLMALVFFIIKSCRKCKWSPRDGTALLSLPLKPELALRGSKSCMAPLPCWPETWIPSLCPFCPFPSSLPPSPPPTRPSTQPLCPRLKGEAPDSSWPLWWDLSLFFLALVAGHSRPSALAPDSEPPAKVRLPCFARTPEASCHWNFPLCYALLTTVVVVVLLSGQWERDSWKRSSDQFGSFLTKALKLLLRRHWPLKRHFPPSWAHSFLLLLPLQLSSPEETLTYASMAFELSEENHNHCTVNHSEDSDHVVYDQVKVTSSPSLFNEGWIQFFTAQLHLYTSLNLSTNLGPQPGETTVGVVRLWSGNAGRQFWKPVPSAQHRAWCTKNVHSASLLNLGGGQPNEQSSKNYK